MTHLKRSLAVLALCSLSAPVYAQDYRVGDIEIAQPWTRATPAGAPTAAGYATITNTGQEADRLVGGSAAGAETVEVHEMGMEDGIMRMRQLEDGLQIAPGETVELKPGSYHLMMIGLDQAYEEGETVEGTLTFQNAGTVEVAFTVAGIGATRPGDAAGEGE